MGRHRQVYAAHSFEESSTGGIALVWQVAVTLYPQSLDERYGGVCVCVRVCACGRAMKQAASRTPKRMHCSELCN